MSFDIDANGIVNVSARDKGTGKEQQIVIQSSGGLSKDQIENMVKEAEANAEADKKRKEGIEAVNAAEGIIHDTEKNLDDFKDDLEEGADKTVREKIAALREYLGTDTDQLDAEEVRKLSSAVQQESLKAFEVAYKKVSGFWCWWLVFITTLLSTVSYSTFFPTSTTTLLFSHFLLLLLTFLTYLPALGRLLLCPFQSLLNNHSALPATRATATPHKRASLRT